MNWSNHVDIAGFGPNEYSWLYNVSRLRRIHTYIVSRTFSSIRYEMAQILPPSCRHNVLIVSHMIARSNKQTSLLDRKKWTSTPRSGIDSDTILSYLETQSRSIIIVSCLKCEWTQTFWFPIMKSGPMLFPS